MKTTNNFWFWLMFIISISFQLYNYTNLDGLIYYTVAIGHISLGIAYLFLLLKQREELKNETIT